MQDNIRKYYFALVKMAWILILLVYYYAQSSLSTSQEVGLFTLYISLLVCLVLTEFLEQRHWQVIACQVFVLLLIYLFYGVTYTFILPVVLLEFMVYLKISVGWYFSVFIGSFIYTNDMIFYMIVCLVAVEAYFQYYIIIKEYKGLLEFYQSSESKLKVSMDQMDSKYKRELRDNHLSFENQMLEEKNRLSQALHDKLGHSINGSVYQLEAAKALIDKEPVHSTTIIQGVIDNLRGSMDEIRALLRKERPSKSRMALLQLQSLCDDCNHKYHMEASLALSGDQNKIPERIWDIILDNSVEAVSNALKYASCSKLTISIQVLNKLVRCSIVDDGCGCKDLHDGMGLEGMRRRVRSINGILDITTNNGFSINMLLPFN